MTRRILTPIEYAEAFNEGKAAGLALGLKANNRHLSIEATDLYDRSTAWELSTAWEMGWWSVCEKLVHPPHPEPNKATVRYWAAVAIVLTRGIFARFRKVKS